MKPADPKSRDVYKYGSLPPAAYGSDRLDYAAGETTGEINAGLGLNRSLPNGRIIGWLSIRVG